MEERESLDTHALDERTAACVSIAWVILLNKPVYPLYVWWLVGPAAIAGSLPTAISGLAYAAMILFARRAPYPVRLALPLTGLADTLLATKLFGPAAGTELFLVPCALLAAVLFSPAEYVTRRALFALLFALTVGLHGRYGAPLAGWPEGDGAKLFDLNALAVASLTAFTGFRFSRL